MDPTSRLLMMGSGGAAAEPVYVEDVFSTWLYTGNSSTQTITNGINLGDTVATYLTGKTLTDLSTGTVSGSVSVLNDGIFEVTNGTNYFYATGTLDVYVDMGVPTVVTQYLLAPQGNQNSVTYNNPTGFNVKASNDAVSWTTVETFSAITTGYPSWNPGSFKPFAFSNSTAYRYWRFEATSVGASLSEWALGIDTPGSGEGGLVWIKSRSDSTRPNLQDTANGTGTFLSTWETSASRGVSDAVTSFNSNGFSLGSGGSYFATNTNAATYTSWTFRKAEKFFDVVTYTGTGADQTISHNLGSTPGCIIVKQTSGAGGDWYVYHRSLPTASENWIRLNNTGAPNGAIGQDLWGPPTSTTFKVDTYLGLSTSSATYVAYLFAHDAGGFGDSGDESVVSCGTFATDGSSNFEVNLGWEPQWVMWKRTNSTGNWDMFDTMRKFTVANNGADALRANLTNAETSPYGSVGPTSTGFKTYDSLTLPASSTYIYIAIRRGPMKTPTDATEVFDVLKVTNAQSIKNFTYFTVDLQWANAYQAGTGFYSSTRLTGVSTTTATGGRFLSLSSTGAEGSGTLSQFWDNTGFQTPSFLANAPTVYCSFRRAPGFFDVVAYTGTGVARTVPHNLGVAPELMIIKNRTAYNWIVYSQPTTAANNLILDQTGATEPNGSAYFNSTAPTSSVFSVGTNVRTNGNGNGLIAYLFATCPGVSKVGSYTGTGTTLNIDCGFTAGARFVLIKRTDSTGDWYVWDTALGIVSGNDPYLLLNFSAAQVTSTDYIDPLSSGFQISSTAPAAINASGGSFIFLAIA